MFVSNLLKNKRVLVAISGGIAAYKSCYVIRELVKSGADVRAMMTANAENFISKLTIETLTNHPVYTDLFPQHQFGGTQHIELADWSEVALIVPATANIIGKLANGIGDDFVSTNLLALHCPILIAPAMNTNMWANPAVQRNINDLQKWGAIICPPEDGFLAEGYTGIGRLARLEYIMQYLYKAIHSAPKSLSGKKVLITAGGTQEYLDPVRMIANRSTGKMGFALAWEAFARGADVTLVHAPGNLSVPNGITSVPIVSADDMFMAVNKHFSECDYYISAAAIADYRPAAYSTEKLKKKPRDLSLVLARTRDVLKSVSETKKAHQMMIGFAVETTTPEANAKKKRIAKKLDLIVLNNPNDSGAGFGSDTNTVKLITKNETHALKNQPKLDVAREIFDFIKKMN